jgi:hypothetical protein
VAQRLARPFCPVWGGWWQLSVQQPVLGLFGQCNCCSWLWALTSLLAVLLCWCAGVDGDALWRTLCPTVSIGDDLKGVHAADNSMFMVSDASRDLQSSGPQQLVLNCSAKFQELFNGFAGAHGGGAVLSQGTAAASRPTGRGLISSCGAVVQVTSRSRSWTPSRTATSTPSTMSSLTSPCR